METKLYNQDALSFLQSIDDNSIDLVLTDPPYGINYKDWDDIDFNEFTDVWVKECVRCLKDTGTMWSFMGYSNIFDFVPILKKYSNIHLENWVVWARQRGRGTSKHLKSMREDIFHVTKSNNFTWNNIKMLREVVIPYVKDGKPRGWFLDENGKRVRWTGLGNVWVYSQPFWNSKDDKQIHGAQKPIKMIERLLLLSSNEEDTILDPFMGSGTTGIACKRNNRNFIGIESNKEIYNLAMDRIKNE